MRNGRAAGTAAQQAGQQHSRQQAGQQCSRQAPTQQAAGRHQRTATRSTAVRLTVSCLHLPPPTCRAKPGAKAKTWQIGDIVTYKPKRCGTTKGPGVATRRVTCKVVGVRRQGVVVYYKLRSNAGVLETQVRGAELERAVPDTAATLTFDDVEVEGLPAVKETALARRGAGKSCTCRKQCGSNCACKKRGAACSHSCGCKCKVGANCGNH